MKEQIIYFEMNDLYKCSCGGVLKKGFRVKKTEQKVSQAFKCKSCKKKYIYTFNKGVLEVIK